MPREPDEIDDTWANMTQSERSEFLDSLDDDERMEVMDGLAERRKQLKPSSSMGSFGSTMQQIGQKAKNAQRRANFEPDLGDVYDPTEEFSK